MSEKVWVILGIISLIYFIYAFSGIAVELMQKPVQLEINKPLVMGGVSINFDSIKLVNNFSRYVAEEKYKYVIINLTARNIEVEKQSFPFYSHNTKLKVDKDYLYEAHYASKLPYYIKPGDSEKGYLLFEILPNTYPTELHIKDWDTGEYILVISQDDYTTSISTD